MGKAIRIVSSVVVMTLISSMTVGRSQAADDNLSSRTLREKDTSGSTNRDDLSIAERFVRRVYSNYSGKREIGFSDIVRSVATPSLARLVERDQAIMSEPSFINYEPLCSYQDMDGFQIEELEMRPITLNRLMANANLRIGQDRILVQLLLVKVNNEWRIDDVIDRNDGSIRSMLLRSIKERSPFGRRR